MKFHFYIGLIISYFLFIHSAISQDTKNKILFGYNYSIDYNLYQRYTKPSTFPQVGRSSGQALNVLPGLQAGFWLGKHDAYIFALQGGIQYMPFSLDLEGYKGMGAISIPVLARASFPIALTKDLGWAIHLGGGLQWSRAEFTAQKQDAPLTTNPFFTTYVAELGFGVMVGWKSGPPMYLGSVFTRLGMGASDALTVDIGLRLDLFCRIGKRKANSSR